MEQLYWPRKQENLTNLQTDKNRHLKNSSVTIKRKIMNTNINTNKTLYIARPKKIAHLNITDEHIIAANKLSGKPYIAYPKNRNQHASTVVNKIDLQEGLYVAYPRQEEASEESLNSFSRLQLTENYLGLPEQPRWSSKKGYSLSVYRSLSKNKWSINTLCQLFKAKVS